MKVYGKLSFAVCVFLMSFVLIYPKSVYAAGDDKRADEIRKKIEALQKKKGDIQKATVEKMSDKKPEGKSLEEIIARYENLMGSMCTKKSDRCADVLFTLAALYYDQSRDGYIKAREDYQRAMDAYDKNPRGKEPINPVPNYNKAAKMYRRLIREYSDFKSVFEAYYQLGTIYLVMGDLDSAKWALTLVVDKAPNSPRASSAHFRLADFSYMDHDFPRTLKHLEACNGEGLTPDNLGMVQYRKGEIYYNLGEFDKAVELFYGYVEKCDAGEYPKAEFRQEALEFMSVAFSDMPHGSDEAIKFFKKVGGKPYQDFVLYTVGMKNRIHGQNDDAIVSLQDALKKYPFYKDAPIAQQMLVECYVIKKDYIKANDAREKLVDTYWPGTEWYSRNANEKAVIDQSKNEVRKALAAIPLYYHGLAQKKKDKELYEKALKRYVEFSQKFPEDKWHNYEFSYYTAEIFNTMGEFEKAAQFFDAVAMADLKTFGAYKPEVDTLGMDQTAIEKEKKEEKSGPIAISQEDAGYNAVVALMNARKKAMAKGSVSEEQSFNLPETKKLLDYIHKYQARFPKSSNAAELCFVGADLFYTGKMYPDAIREYKIVIDGYPDSKFGQKALRMIANCYVNTGEFDLASGKYKEILRKTPQNAPDYQEVIDLAAGAMFKKAEAMKKSNNVVGAAETFKAISTEYPKSKVSDRGWFQAAECYIATNHYEQGAGVFQELAEKFPQSTLRENAFMRAAEAYKKVEKWDKAAIVYQAAAMAISKADYAIPSLSSAAEAYQKVNDFDNAGKMYELVFERYAKDAKTPQALYNAGLIYEKGKLYEKAIRAYGVLSQNFSNSEFAAEAYFSIGLCYEKMGKNTEMAGVFADFARKYENDKYKQIEALTKAGDAYYNMNDLGEAQKNYDLAVAIYEKFKGKTDIDIAIIAKAYYMKGECLYKLFTNISLAGNAKQVKKNLEDKEKALKDAAVPFSKAIEVGVEEWTVRGTYKIGLAFADFADAIENQNVEGSTEQKMAAKIKILMSLGKYYESAMKYFQKNIEWAYDQNIAGEYVNKSMDMFMKSLFLRANSIEKVGVILKASPIPRDLAPEEKKAYQEVLEEKALEAMDKALPLYEAAVQTAQQLGIATSSWLEKAKERIKEINPSSPALAIQITPHQYKQAQTPVATPAAVKEGGIKENASKNVASKDAGNKDVVKAAAAEEMPTAAPDESGAANFRDDAYMRNMKRIQNIMQMDLAVDDKVKQLKRIEIEAQREIQTEGDKIEELKKKL
jgi:tetratricopeptide (TPR) repeat protein